MKAYFRTMLIKHYLFKTYNIVTQQMSTLYYLHVAFDSKFEKIDRENNITQIIQFVFEASLPRCLTSTS
jgi:hypothetical protein